MRIPRFYFPDTLTLGARVVLPKAAAHHALRVLRLGEGDIVCLFNGDNHLYHAPILRSDKLGVVVLIESRIALSCESTLSILLVQGISSGERMDYTLQKAVELGVVAIQPIQAERSVVKLIGERREKRMQHWRNIVTAACEQCGRNTVPEVKAVSGLTEWLGEPAPAGQRILLAPDAERRMRELAPPTIGALTLAVGPEGGFSDKEQTALLQCGFTPVRLGPRVLRTETAALAALASLQALWGDY
jgi:16S rRNA (uracil1498-N3)-methyltransferase